MSVDKNNQTYKKTSFLSGVNSDYIEEYYAFIFQNPNLLTNDWIEFFDGLNEDTKNILQNIKGPSWNPKKIKQLDNFQNTKIKTRRGVNELTSVKQASTDSVRAIMLIRAYRIRGHLIANLDPLNFKLKRNILNLNQKLMDLKKKIIIEKYF